MNEVIIRIADLPPRVNGVTVEDENGDYNVTINARCAYECQVEVYLHEMLHIVRNDFHNDKTIEQVELAASNL